MSRLNKKSLIFVIILVLLCVFCLLWFLMIHNISGTEAHIYVDGTLYAIYSLSDNSDFLIETQYGYNKVKITDGKIGVTESDCPDRTCINTGFTDNSAHPVICMPHRLEIIIVDSSEIDGVTG